MEYDFDAYQEIDDPFDDDDRAYEAFVESQAIGMDFDPFYMSSDEWSPLPTDPVIPGVPENHVPGQMDIYELLWPNDEDIPF